MKIKNKKLVKSLFLIIAMFSMAKPASASEINQANLLYLLNNERAKNGLTALKVDTDLQNAASLKSRDMINRDYFEHYAYDLTPWIFIKNSGYEYLYAGENLAMDFATAEGMVNAWMKSPNHRRNILEADFEDVGIGIVKGEFTENNSNRETIMVTNMFGKRKPLALKIYNYISRNISLIFSPK